MNNVLVQIKISLGHANFVTADNLDTKILMNYKYPSQPYDIGILFKGDLKKARNCPIKKFPKSLVNKLQTDFQKLAKAIKEYDPANKK